MLSRINNGLSLRLIREITTSGLAILIFSSVLGVAAVAVIVAMTVWFASYIGDFRGAEPPFSMAQISATLGGLLLVGSFVGHSAERFESRLLVLAAKSFILATVCFIYLGMVLPFVGPMPEDTPGFQIWVWSTAIGYAIAGVAFVAGTIAMLMVLPSLNLPKRQVRVRTRRRRPNSKHRFQK